jgi:hypothetical protein
MVRKVFWTGLAVLVVAGVTLAAEKRAAKEAGQRNVAFGKVVSLELQKDGTGTLTVMARPARNEEPTEKKFQITKDTKWVQGASRNQEGTPVEAGQVEKTYKADATVAIRYDKEGDSLIAKRVNAVTPRPEPENN